MIAAFRRSRFGKEVTDEEIKQALAEEIAAILMPVAKPLVLDPARKPHVVLVVGVNGTGKTTTIGKLAQQYHDEGKRAVLVAGRHVPRGGGRAIADLGPAHRRAGDRRRTQRRLGGPRVRRADQSAERSAPTCC